MDIKSKGISWVGNIYQRFETMCHEVDNIVNQDAVKYVENQVQTVGGSMKKFCSDVVQVVDPVRSEAQAVALKGNAAVGTYIKSIIGAEDHRHTYPIRHSYLEPKDLDTTTGFEGLNLANQSTVPAPEESHEEIESDSAGNVDDVITNEESDLSAEENATEDKSNALETLDLTDSLMKKSSSASPSNELIDSNNESARFSLGEGVPSNIVAPSEMAFSVAASCGSILTEPHTLPGNSFHDILGNIESYDNPFNVPAHDSDIACSLVSSVALPILSSDKKESDTGFTCSNRLLSLELTDSSSSYVSSISGPIVSSNKEEAETGFTSSNSVISLESTDRSSSLLSSPILTSNKEEVETGLSCSYSIMSLDSTGCSSSSISIIDDITDCGMDTIDLSDKLKLGQSCVIVDNNLLYEISRRINRKKSYKKKLQDIFNSKKRLNKEYEQLAIWFGDLDTESSQSEPISTTVILDPDFRIEQPQDSEWELL